MLLESKARPQLDQRLAGLIRGWSIGSFTIQYEKRMRDILCLLLNGVGVGGS